MGKRFEFDFIPFTHDQIREMSEEDLNKNIAIFKRKIKEASRAGMSTMPYEVEYCYLDHEKIMRDRTRKAHEQFVRERRSKRAKRNFTEGR